MTWQCPLMAVFFYFNISKRHRFFPYKVYCSNFCRVGTQALPCWSIHIGTFLSRDCIPGIQLIILALFLDQLVVGSPLNDPALFQYHDAVRILNR